MLVPVLVLLQGVSFLANLKHGHVRVMNGLYILAMQCIGDTVSSKVFNW